MNLNVKELRAKSLTELETLIKKSHEPVEKAIINDIIFEKKNGKNVVGSKKSVKEEYPIHDEEKDKDKKDNDFHNKKDKIKPSKDIEVNGPGKPSTTVTI